MWVSTSTLAPSSAAIALFQPVRHLVRLAQRQPAVDFQIERDRQPVFEFVHRDVMHGERAVARDHHHAVEHGFVVERDRMRW